MKKYSILVCGTGGTGVVGLGMLLKNAAFPEGYKVVGSETRGSAQRGGVVTSSIRYLMDLDEENNNSLSEYLPPSLSVGGADLMIATEASEAIRQLIYLNKESRIILNTFKVAPKGTNKGKDATPYPGIDKIRQNISNITPNIYVVNASDISIKRYNTYRMTNPILLGVAKKMGKLPLKKENILSFLKTDEAKNAFKLGCSLEVN